MTETDDVVADGAPIALRDGSQVRIRQAVAQTARCCFAAFSV
jgi:hypothetical protein